MFSSIQDSPFLVWGEGGRGTQLVAGSSWVPYSVNTKDAPLPAQSSIMCTVTCGISKS